ncbi:MAG: gamma-glutamyl-gamma-aminobutyrate hydrolase family protein [Butyricicoccus sp.]
MKQRPVIGVLPLYDEEKESLWMLPGYPDCLQEAGALPLMLPQRMDQGEMEQVLRLCDGFLFTGGHDVNPELYGEKALPECGLWNEERDKLEAALFRLAYQEDKPMLGICRGIQLFNAMLGGTLYQDLPSQRSSSTEHHMHPPYDRPCHRVYLTHGEPLAQLLGCTELAVNSYHHQAVKRMADGLRMMARSEDNLVEAVYDPSKTFVWAVQWHPEFSFRSDGSAGKIVSAFVRACRNKQIQKPWESSCEIIKDIV